MKLFLLRHGETVFNAQGRAPGFSDPELTELGRRQAQALANTLASETLTAVYASDLKRAVETARIIAQAHAIADVHTALSVGKELPGPQQEDAL